jgi:hypothetical protein
VSYDDIRMQMLVGNIQNTGDKARAEYYARKAWELACLSGTDSAFELAEIAADYAEELFTPLSLGGVS